MKMRMVALLTIGLWIAQVIPCAAASQKARIEALQGFSLNPPRHPAQRAYLGLTGEGASFTIPDIAAEVVIIEIFSMYCPHCQREAPEVNALYKAIEDIPQLKGRIKVLGIGAANTDYEVDLFRTTYSIPFPLASDEDFKISECFEETIRTPFFIGARIHEDRILEVFLYHLGSMMGSKQFLNRVVKESGLK